MGDFIVRAGNIMVASSSYKGMLIEVRYTHYANICHTDIVDSKKCQPLEQHREGQRAANIALLTLPFPHKRTDRVPTSDVKRNSIQCAP